MNFGEMIQSILGNPTFETIMSAVATVGSVIAVFLHKSSNTKFKTTDVLSFPLLLPQVLYEIILHHRTVFYNFHSQPNQSHRRIRDKNNHQSV